jgi:hypothetical protein
MEIMSWLNYWTNWSISMLKAWGYKMMHCWCILNAMFLHNHNFCVGFYTVLVCMSAKMLTACWLQDGIHLMSAQRNVEFTSFVAIWSHLAWSSNSSEMKLLDIKQRLGLCQNVEHIRLSGKRKFGLTESVFLWIKFELIQMWIEWLLFIPFQIWISFAC